MKLAESWLREWTNPALSTEQLAHQLTMAGHEVDGVEITGDGLDGVLVALVREVAAHPDADRLRVCQVDAGNGELIEVVCGAPNVYAGMKTALALPGTRLPNGLKLRKSKIRGVESNGMLCSAIELGLGDESDGILDLPPEAPIGEGFAGYLQLPDAVIDVDLTPNRGDCFSVLGLAREVSALTGAELKPVGVSSVAASSNDEYAIALTDTSACPRFVGRVIRGIDPAARTPIWMVERRRRAGVRAIYPVVDITNYVMLELGQPLHAYDLNRLQGTIMPRFANKGEKVVLLDEREVELTPDTLVIADDSGPIGIAGIMGGLSTAVAETTCDIFLESAFFSGKAIAGRARTYGLHTDASQRFERGVDPAGQARAIERATELLLQIAGGKAGPTCDVLDESALPARRPVSLRSRRMAKILGTAVPDSEVNEILAKLEIEVRESNEEGWSVIPPTHRFDLEIEEDLVEEVARVYGYDRIPETTAIAAAPLLPVTESAVELSVVASILVARGYQEVITYSFVDAELNEQFCGSRGKLVLSNPISSEMSVMRSSLLPGLAKIAAANLARQRERVRIFEIGKSFHGDLDAHEEIVRIAGLVVGPVAEEQWDVQGVYADFFDIKSDVVAVLAKAGLDTRFEFEPAKAHALQPGQSARILRDGTEIGLAGRLHPALAQSLDISAPVMVFELDAKQSLRAQIPSAGSISKYPSVRRDLAIIVDEGISAAALTKAIAAVDPTLIRDVRVFDVYRGKGIEAGRKSVALGLILQETSRTLTDKDADAVVESTIAMLEQQFAAALRD
jgi:phenylalanyl-tRNA synthetase beta chain